MAYLAANQRRLEAGLLPKSVTTPIIVMGHASRWFREQGIVSPEAVGHVASIIEEAFSAIRRASSLATSSGLCMYAAERTEQRTAGPSVSMEKYGSPFSGRLRNVAGPSIDALKYAR